mmetsp:Transcript_36815/g.72846  ORF Transcript_36815/g.72846 Transcript_36815/m.72846 type:complete len:281 (-) Transcript_36815:173-1015(-)
MGKAKNQESVSFVVDVKEVLGLRPEQRQRWLVKACRKAADGEANVKHVYDVLTSRRLTTDMSDKVGRRMLRVLREHLYLFSEKQQRWLSEESPLAMQFSVDERSDGDIDDTEDLVGSSRGTRKPQADNVAARMEEMMARCRDFVRAKASTFEERQQQAEEAENQARLARQRQAEEQKKQEWAAIDKWHKQLEGWEQACLAACDERRHVLEAAAAAAAVAAAIEKGPDRKSRSRRGRSASRSRRRRRRHRSSSSSSQSSRDHRRRVPGERRHHSEYGFTSA